MAISPYVVRLRSLLGQDLILLPSVTVLARNDRNQLLLVRHVGSDRWGTVGGMVEPEEHPRDAAAREVKEETGLDVEITSLITTAGGPGYTVTYPNGDRASYVTSVFAGRVTGGVQSIDTSELTAMRWIDDSDLGGVKLDGFAETLFNELHMV